MKDERRRLSELLFDVDNTTFQDFAPSQPTVRKHAVHAMFNF